MTLDPYGRSLSIIASRCEYQAGGMGVIGFEYRSIKDSIRDFGLSVRSFRKDIAMIGKLVTMEEDKFDAVINGARLDEITAEDIRNAFKRSE